MSLFSKFKLDTAPTNLATVALPVPYSTLTSSNRYLVRERYARLQGHLCWHCGQDLNGDPTEAVMNTRIRDPRMFPGTFFDHPIHLHHDHYTDDTIGAVHARCNAVLWQEYEQ